MASTISISILGNAKPAVDAFSKVQSAAEKTQGHFSKLNGAIAVFGGNLITSAARSLAGLFVGAIDGAQEAARNMRVLQSQINNLGPAGRKAFAGASKFADQLGASIGVDDDNIRAVQAKLASFPEAFKKGSLGAQGMERSVKAAFDLQAIGIGDAQSNIIGIGKAMNDPIKGMGALAKSGVSFTKEQKDQIQNYIKQGKLAKAQEILLQGIESNAKGAAAAAASPIDKMHVAFQNFIEGIVGQLLPTFNTVADFVVQKVIPKLQQLVDWLGPKITAAAQFLAGPVFKKSFVDNIVTPIKDFLDKHGAQISNFFGDLWDRLKQVDIGKLKQTAENVVKIGGVFQIGAGIAKHPILTLLGYLAQKYPAETATILAEITSAVSGVIDFAAKHKGAVQDLLLLIGAYKGLQAVKGLKLPDLFSGASSAASIQAGAGSEMMKAAQIQAGAASTMLRAAGMQDAGAVGNAAGGAAASVGIRGAAVAMMAKFSAYLLAAFNAASFVNSLWELIQGKNKAFNITNLITGGALGTVTDTSASILKALGMDPKTVDKIMDGFKKNMLGQIGSFFSRDLPNALAGVLTSGADTKGGWSGLGHNIIDGIKGGIGDALSGINGWIGEKVNEIVTGFKKWLGISSPSTVFAGIGGDIVRGLWNGITKMLGGLSFISIFSGAFNGAITWLVNAGINILTGLKNGISAAWTTVTTEMGRARSKVAGVVAGALTWLTSTGRSIIQGVANGISGAWSIVTSELGRAKSKVTSAVSNAASWLYQAGRDIIGGLHSGMSSVWGALVSWYNAQLDKLPGHPLDRFKIHSPSLVFFDIGKNIMMGLWQGMKSQSRNIDKTLDNVLSKFDVQPSLGFSTDFGSTTLTSTAAAPTQIIVNVPPTSNPAEVGREIMKALQSYSEVYGRPIVVTPNA